MRLSGRNPSGKHPSIPSASRPSQPGHGPSVAYQSGDIPCGAGDGAGLAEGYETVGRLRPEVTVGSAKNHFHHAYCPACAARSLVVLPPFAWPQGRGDPTSINGSPPVYVWLAGRDLFQTLFWNLALPHYRPKAAAVLDRPWWRDDEVVDAAQVRRAVGFLESLTWQPRRARLIPGLAGDCSLCGESALWVSTRGVAS